MEILHHLVSVLALPVGMHHDDAPLSHKPLQSVFDLDRGQGRVWIAGHDIPKNKLESEGAGYVDSLVVKLPVRRTKQSRAVTVFGSEQTDRPKHFLFLLLCRLKRHMSVDIPMGADFEERDLQESLHLPIVFCDPFSRHEEGRRNLLLDQIVDQRLIIARSVPHWAEIERQRNSGAGKWA